MSIAGTPQYTNKTQSKTEYPDIHEVEMKMIEHLTPCHIHKEEFFETVQTILITQPDKVLFDCREMNSEDIKEHGEMVNEVEIFTNVRKRSMMLYRRNTIKRYFQDV